MHAPPSGDDGLLLLHGGAHGSWCWDRVRPLLRYPSLAVDLPGRDSRAIAGALTGADFLRAACAALDATSWRRATVVAHSLSGMVACHLADARPQLVRHIVGISAIIPRHGMRAIDLTPRPLRGAFAAGFRVVLHRTGTYSLPRPVSAWMFCNGMGDTDRRETVARMCPENGAVWFEPFDVRVPAHVGRSWIRPRHDRALPARLQQQMSEHLGATETFSIDSGHDVMISNPIDLATVLNEVSAKVFAGE